MTVNRPDGGATRPASVAILGPGEAFGWSSIVEPHISTLSAKAVDTASLISLEGTALWKALDHDRNAGYLVTVGLAKLLADRLVCTRESLILERGWAMLA